MNLITAKLAAPSLWEEIRNGLHWFFTGLSPATLWAVLTLVVCVAFFVYYWHCLKPRRNSLEWVSMAAKKDQPRQMTLTLRRHPFTRKDVVPMLLITVIYAATAFFRLGSTDVPQTYTKFVPDFTVAFSFEEPVTVDKLSYYTSLGTGSYQLEYSLDGSDWQRLTLKQSYVDLFKWKINDLNSAEDGKTPIGPITATQFRISGKQIDRSEGVWLTELALWNGEEPLLPNRVDEAGAALFDESHLWTTTYTYMNSTYFDEIYHPRTALEHLENIYP